ncbi:MAG: hypothetical protein J6L87_00010 [Clostridia bacterium]|nr:hypothetical protein [Clostridia bacterium]
MNDHLQKEIKTYQKSIRKHLPWLSKRHRIILQDFFCEMENYAAEHPNASIAEIKEKFGAPEAVAASILSVEEAKELKKRAIKIGALLAVAAILTLALSFTGILLYDIHKNQKNYHHYSDVYSIERMD